MIVTDSKKVLGVIKDISDQLTIIAAARESIKEAINAAAEEHELDKKDLRKVANAYFKQNYSSEVAAQENFKELYETVVGVQS